MDRKDRPEIISDVAVLQAQADAIAQIQEEIGGELQAIKQRIEALALADRSKVVESTADLDGPSRDATPPKTDFVPNEAKARSPERIGIGDVLTDDDWVAVDNRIAAYVEEFNARYALDRWDDAIAGG